MCFRCALQRYLPPLLRPAPSATPLQSIASHSGSVTPEEPEEDVVYSEAKPPTLRFAETSLPHHPVSGWFVEAFSEETDAEENKGVNFWSFAGSRIRYNIHQLRFRIRRTSGVPGSSPRGRLPSFLDL